jgi:hypothetical protein
MSMSCEATARIAEVRSNTPRSAAPSWRTRRLTPLHVQHNSATAPCKRSAGGEARGRRVPPATGQLPVVELAVDDGVGCLVDPAVPVAAHGEKV